MTEISGDLWEQDGYRVITTNGTINKRMRAVMGRGVAKQAATRYPNLPLALANRLWRTGNHTYVFTNYRIITFPVKHNWWEAADPALIERSAQELVAGNLPGTIYLPRPGCGNGRLRWEHVKPIIEPILVGDQFVIVNKGD